VKQVEKVLSKNDTGETGGHQSGFLVPKRPRAIREFLPPLDTSIENPRCPLDAIDDAGDYWSFQYIHYNKKLFGTGTRNESRITGLAGFIRKYLLRAGDAIILRREGRIYRITFRRKDAPILNPDSGRKRIIPSGSWFFVESEEA
jgi:hypothetical protein